MVGIILASHGEFAEGILQSGTMIFGEQENVQAVTLMPSEGPADLKAKMEAALATFDSQEEVLFLVDLWGGTPFNQANGLLEEVGSRKDTWAIVAGLNLPMLIETYASRFSMTSAQAIATHVTKTAIEGVQVKPEHLAPDMGGATPAEAKLTMQGAIPPGTVIGDGKIDIALARIDSRLLHGQVATGWAKAVTPNRIIVVSDEVAKDDLRKKLIEQAAPPGIKANVVPINKMIEVGKDPRFGETKALLLFENPQDVVRVLEGGLEIKEVNVGSMAHSVGKVLANKVLSFGPEDITSFEKMKEFGVSFDVRKVPNDSRGNMEEILVKAEEELQKHK